MTLSVSGRSQTSFQSGTQLHDYTGRHRDISTDAQGRATFVMPSNAFGSGQSYLCFSRTGQDRTPTPHGRAAQQRFYGAQDLDIAPLANGSPVTLPRVYPAAGTSLHATLHVDRRSWKRQTAVTLEVLDPSGNALGTHTWNSNSADAFGAHARMTGWHTLRLAATGLADTAPFELDLTYTAPQTL